MAVAEGRERGVLASLDRGVDLAEEVAERLAVAFAVAGGIARETPRRLDVVRRVLHDDLLRARGGAEQHLGGKLLVPRQAGDRSLALEQQLVLAATGARREHERSCDAVAEAEQQRCVVLERATGKAPEVR